MLPLGDGLNRQAGKMVKASNDVARDAGKRVAIAAAEPPLEFSLQALMHAQPGQDETRRHAEAHSGIELSGVAWHRLAEGGFPRTLAPA